MTNTVPLSDQVYNDILRGLLQFKGKHGLYIIRPKTVEILQAVCDKLGYDHKSNIAYIGKGGKTSRSDLSIRAKQEMGWSNFEGATFVRKIGRYLGFDISDKRNKELKAKTKEFICSNFYIEFIVFDCSTDLLIEETKYINSLKPCLNDKKNNAR